MAKGKRNEKLFITEGLRIGRLEVGDLVYDVIRHELFESTPKSYLQQGRLRVVLCDCGERRLISESILSTGRIQSCGCLREEIRIQSSQRKVERLKKEAAKMAIQNEIKIEQAKLRTLQLARGSRDEKAIEECGAKLRKLFARKGLLNRKESHKETAKRIVAQQELGE